MANEFDNPISQETINELLSKAREADREDRNRAELFERMVAGEAWRSYVALLNARVQIFADAIQQPSGSVDGAWKLEYIKGAMFGILLAQSLPSAIIETMKALRRDQDIGEETGQ